MTILRSAPYFPVRDVASSLAHYEQTLGFEAEYVAGNPPEFAIVSRNGHAIFLRKVDQPIHPNESQGGTWDVFFWVASAHELYGEMLSRGAAIVYAPKNTPYQTIEFAVRDNEGYVLGFGQETRGGDPSAASSPVE